MFATGLKLPDGEDWRVFWNKPEETHINYSDKIFSMVEKPSRKDQHVLAGRESNGEMSCWLAGPALPQDLESHWLLATNLRNDCEFRASA